MPTPPKRKRWSRRIHRWSGLILLVPILIASLTGLILNHTVDLDLSNRHVSANWIQARYGMALEGEPTAFGLEGKAHAAEWDGKIFFGNKLIDDESRLVGAVPLRDGTAVVTTGAVHYFGLDGELIETLGSVTLPSGEISRAGRTENLELTLETGEGIFKSDANLLEFSDASAANASAWSEKIVPEESQKQLWKTAFSGEGIPMDRVILDIHSGRFFGNVGKWIYDLTVIGVVILSITGFVLFLRTRKRKP